MSSRRILPATGLFSRICAMLAGKFLPQGNALVTSVKQWLRQCVPLVVLLAGVLSCLQPATARDFNEQVIAKSPPLLQPLTTEQGLSSGTLNRLLLDKAGFLWLAGDRGLARYDAQQVRQISLGAGPATELAISQLLEDAQGRFWLAAEHQGLYRLNRQTAHAELVLPLAQLEHGRLPRLFDLQQQDADHLLLAINTAVYRWQISSGKLEKIFDHTANHPMPRVRFMQMFDHWLLIGTNSGLYRVNLTSGIQQKLTLHGLQPERRPDAILSLYRHQQDVLLAAGRHLYRFAQAQLATSTAPSVTLELVKADLQVDKILPFGAGLLLATRDGLYQADAQLQQLQARVRFTETPFNIDQDAVIDLVASADGGYWLASRQQGAYYWHPDSMQFNHLKLPATAGHLNAGATTANYSPRSVHALAPIDHERLLLATPGGFHIFAPASRTLRQLPPPVNIPPTFSPIVARVYPQSADVAWLRSGFGLFLYNYQQQRFLPPPLANPAQLDILQNNAASHWRDAQGRFWFVSGEQYYLYDPANGSLDELDSLKKAEPAHKAGRFLGQVPQQMDVMILAAADRLWAYHSKTRQVHKIYEASPYQPGLQRFADKLCTTADGQLWVSGNGLGLLVFDAKTLKLQRQLGSKDGLPDNQLFACETDLQGNIWVAHQQGLSRVNPASWSVQTFSRQDGLSGSEFNIAASLRLADGTLVYGSNSGLTWFQPANLSLQPAKPGIVITGVDAMNQPASKALHDLAGATFEFPHDSLGIEIRFSSLNFRDSGNIRYQFWLEGDNSLTFPPQASSIVRFPQLSPGRYQFYVKAISIKDGAESATAGLTLQITAPTWASPVALSSYTLLGVVLLGLWLHNRRVQKKLLAQAHERVLTSEQRLTQALDAVNSGVWDYQAARDSMYAQRVHQMLGYSEELNPLSMLQHLKLIHPDDRDSYYQAWQRFVAEPAGHFDFTYRMQHKDGSWLWFRDIGKITARDGQLASRVIGTYSNITETRASKEKARLFGEAFQQTRDWVVLLDPAQRVLAANQSFTDVFGNMDDYLHNPRVHELGISLDRRRFYTRLLSSMQPNQHWQGEELVISPDGIERPTLLNISAVGEREQVEFYVLVFTDITAQKQAEEDLRYLANYDALTGLPNRTLLMDRILHGIETAKREKRSLALCFIDLDKFKQINDSLGHDIGDLLLKQIARRLTSILRLTDTVARLGGDEFVVLLESYKNDDNISHVARKMLKAIAEPMQLSSHRVSVSPSIGIAVYPEDAADATELLKHADVAMYHAKDLGRNNFQFFIQQMNDKAHMQLALETRLRTGWQQDEFVNFYQPIYDSMQQKFVGAEVLMRWQRPDGMVPPNEFIPLAEDLRLIVPMTQQLLVRALADLQQWHAAGYPLYLSVNLSPRHLEQPQLASETAALLAQYDLPASCLRFEVTESALMQDHQSAIATMLALSDLGVQLALDDFGTGYSSLKYLKELPIDGIKIDRSFVKDIGIDRNDETIIDAILSMSNSLGMYCIAEGVESEQQLAFFSQRGCFLIQGYLFGKPMPAAQLLQALQQ